MAVTLAEIAALAGVSRGTVDRALNDRGRVDPKVAARVRRIAAERGYRPNRAGRMLARAKNPIRIFPVPTAKHHPTIPIFLCIFQ